MGNFADLHVEMAVLIINLIVVFTMFIVISELFQRRK